MRHSIFCLLIIIGTAQACAHHPDRANRPVRQPIDLIGPIGNRLPMEYRRRYNRPTHWGGKVAYKIAPTSQEAMRWHRATHQGQYECRAPRMVANYFYPKPWEVLAVGTRTPTDADQNVGEDSAQARKQAEGETMELEAAKEE